MSQTPASEEPKAPRRRKSANPHGEVRILDKAEAAAQVEELRPAKAAPAVVETAPVVEAPAPVVEAPAPVVEAPAPVVEAPAPAAPAADVAPARAPAKGKKPVRAIPPPPGWVTARTAAPAAAAPPAPEPAPKPAPAAPAPKPAAAPPKASGGALFQVLVEGADSPVFVVAADSAGAIGLLKGRFSAAALAKARVINVGDVL